MAYQVIARKWRPQAFSEIVGQQHIIQTLLNALHNKRLHHSLLLTGPRGTGKTSTARILAKSLRCANARDFVPCNVCRDCLDIANGRSLDVQEIDGASNNGVDAVRELRDSVGYMPSSGQYKLYIIDEVHMLSTSAFNALLKTLEEPPAHVIFVLATTEVQKIPNTILSRCQRFDFRLLPTRQITERLKFICEQEGVVIEEEALWAIARQSEGSLRDSLSLLDQVITFSSDHVTYENVTHVLGLTDRAMLLRALEALCTRNSTEILLVIRNLSESGHDPKIFAQDLLEELRHLLMVRLYNQHAEKVIDLPDSEIQLLTRISADLSEEDIHLLFDMALKGGHDLTRAHDPRLVLEMVLLRMTHAPRIRELCALSTQPMPVSPTASTKEPTKNPSLMTHSNSSAKLPQTTTPITTSTNSVNASLQKKKQTPLTPSPQGTKRPRSQPDNWANEYDQARSPEDNWAQLVEKLKKQDPRVGAKLENVSILNLGEGRLHLAVAANMGFLFEQLCEANFLSRLEKDISQIWGGKYAVQFSLSAQSSAHQPLSPKAKREEERQQQEQLMREKILDNELVQQTQSIFDAEIKAIKEMP